MTYYRKFSYFFFCFIRWGVNQEFLQYLSFSFSNNIKFIIFLILLSYCLSPAKVNNLRNMLFYYSNGINSPKKSRAYSPSLHLNSYPYLWKSRIKYLFSIRESFLALPMLVEICLYPTLLIQLDDYLLLL